MGEMTWIKYSAEEVETWVRLKPAKADNQHDNQLVEDGTVSFMKVMPPADEVTVSFLPTSKIVDDVTGKVGEQGRYHIKLSLLSNEAWFAISFKSYDKTDALKIGSKFIGLNQHQAGRVWNAKKLGEINSTKLSW